MTADGEFDTLDPDPETSRELGYEVVDMMAEHYSQVRDVDAFPDVTPPEVAAEFDDPLPRDGEDPETVLAEWEERVYHYAAHQGSPRWYGYVMGSGAPIGALADALADARRGAPRAIVRSLPTFARQMVSELRS